MSCAFTPQTAGWEVDLQQQVRRAIAHVRGYTKPINKYVYLEQLRSSNATLFYKVLLEHVVELLPCIYTPTVGEACQKFGEIFRNNAGESRGQISNGMCDARDPAPDAIPATPGVSGQTVSPLHAVTLEPPTTREPSRS